MLLAIDIGNTNIKSALFKGKKIIKRFDLPVKTYSKGRFAKKLASNQPISAAAICSVVPKLTVILKHDLKLLTGKTPYIIGKDLIVPMKNLYRNPKQLGQDRLVAAYAASNLYHAPLIVMDSGTAITFDIVSKEKTYLGGLILPGMEISFEALKAKTALLPKIKLQKPKALIGTDTKNSILSGIVFGTACLAKELVNKIKQRIGKDTLVIGTGGNIHLIKKYAGMGIKIDPDLTLKGINLIYGNKI
ncbi:MAG: type III pantothenate kinase [Candidatus Omnitrophica bacterium]|nr:type III pantothenate kinase [Candidatus Omnitrophota bacterium]